MSKIIKKCIIVGAGYMGKVHARAYNNMKNVELTAVIDGNNERALEFAAEFGCDHIDDFDKAIAGDIDFVDICLPTKAHRDIVIKCFIEGKDVICEKPISLSVEEAQEMSDAARKYDRKFMIAHVVRFWPEYFKLTGMIKSGEINDIKYITFSRYGSPPQWSLGNWMLSDAKSGGIIYDLSIHDIDYAISLFGMPEWVFARKNVINDDYTAYINAVLGYKGINVLIESGFIMTRPYPFTTGFRVCTGNSVYEYVNKTRKGLLKYSEADPEAIKLEYEDYDPYQRELEYFVNCLEMNIEPEIGSSEDAVKAVKLARCLEISANTCEKVIVI